MGLPLRAAQSTARNQTGLGLNLWPAAHQLGDLRQVFGSPLASVFPSVSATTAAHEAVMLMGDDAYKLGSEVPGPP